MLDFLIYPIKWAEGMANKIVGTESSVLVWYPVVVVCMVSIVLGLAALAAAIAAVISAFG
jgi:hypothetical protein